MFLLEVTKTLDRFKVPYAIVGGHAVALHGALRGTVDIDFITKWTLKNLVNIEKAMNRLGLSSRLPITAEDLFNFKDEYIKNKNLIAWNFTNTNNPIQQIDIIINYDLTGKSTKEIKIKNSKLIILSISDLIKMKKASGRPQDLADIEALEKLNEN